MTTIAPEDAEPGAGAREADTAHAETGRAPSAEARRRIVLAVMTVAAGGLSIAAAALGWGLPARAAVLGGFCVALWLTETVPLWVPTLVVWIATPLLLGGYGPQFSAPSVLRWSADPVLALFFGGFTLAAAASAHGADRAVAGLALRLSRGEGARLMVLAAAATALLSMWMSNIAAAALMLGALRPVLDAEPRDGTLRRAVLLAVALGADVGGIATPIGTGPNAIAIAAVEAYRPLTFVHWMAFGVPLVIGLLIASLALAWLWLRPTGRVALPPDGLRGPTDRIVPLAVVFSATVLLWLTEPLHGVRAWMVALGAAAALFVLRLLVPRDLLRIDWATLLLIAGGIALGALLGRSGLMEVIATRLPLGSAPPVLRLLGLCFLAATLAALMSNTGTATVLVPLAMTISPTPSTAVLVAVAASLGIPFVVSTPPNAMAVGAGLRGRDLLLPGLVIMLGGCLLIVLTGPWVLRALGIP
jgi:sodium-dependent dicarboxylate transporter 2/3/5